MIHTNCKAVQATSPNTPDLSFLENKVLIVDLNASIKKGDLIYFEHSKKLLIAVASIIKPAKGLYKVIACQSKNDDMDVALIDPAFVLAYEENPSLVVKSCTVKRLDVGLVCFVDYKEAVTTRSNEPITLHCPIVGSYSLLGTIVKEILLRNRDFSSLSNANITILFDQILPGIDLVEEVTAVLEHFPNVKIVKK